VIVPYSPLMEGGGGRSFALLGSGEFEPWTDEVDRWLLARARPGRILVLPTASAPEGDHVFERWGRSGLEHYARRGFDAAVLPLKTAADAARPELVAALEDAAMVFFSGGNPGYLAETMAGSPFWRAVVEHLDRGLAYAGCSAGANALGELTAWRLDRGALGPGLGLFPGTNIAPHWDVVDAYVPGIRAILAERLGPPHRLAALDERTALVGDGRRWTVIGSGGVHLLENGKWRHAGAGQRVALAG
jgi:cyanophycinase